MGLLYSFFERNVNNLQVALSLCHNRGIKAHERMITLFKGQYDHITHLNRSKQQVWHYFQDAQNLAKITRFPRVHIISAPAVEKGNVLHMKLGMFGFKLDWKAQFSAVQSPDFFTDEALQPPFPFKYWRHTHHFEGDDQHTVMTDDVSFEAVLPVWMIKIGLRIMFADRRSALNKQFNR